MLFLTLDLQQETYYFVEYSEVRDRHKDDKNTKIDQKTENTGDTGAIYFVWHLFL